MNQPTNQSDSNNTFKQLKINMENGPFIDNLPWSRNNADVRHFSIRSSTGARFDLNPPLKPPFNGHFRNRFIGGTYHVAGHIFQGYGYGDIPPKYDLVGGLEHSVFFHILGIIIPSDWYCPEGLKPPKYPLVNGNSPYKGLRCGRYLHSRLPEFPLIETIVVKNDRRYDVGHDLDQGRRKPGVEKSLRWIL